jgi:hypothetical protein
MKVVTTDCSSLKSTAAQVPSPRKNLLWSPATGVGTIPEEPSAFSVAPTIVSAIAEKSDEVHF